MKKLLTSCSGMAVAFAVMLSGSQATFAQEFIEVLPEVGTVEELGAGSNGNFKIMQRRVEDPAPGFRAYDIWAEPVASGDGLVRYVNAFSDLNITGVHQVWEAPRRSTNSPTETGYPNFFGDFSPKLQALDSYLSWDEGDKNNGADPSETNDGTNPAGIDPEVYDPDAGYVAAIPLGQAQADSLHIGLGELGIWDRSGGGAVLAVGLGTTNAQQPLAHIVLWDGAAAADGHYATATLLGQLGGEANGDPARGELDNFAGVVLGAPTLVEVPEPAMGVLAMMALAGLSAARRRNG